MPDAARSVEISPILQVLHERWERIGGSDAKNVRFFATINDVRRWVLVGYGSLFLNFNRF